MASKAESLKIGSKQNKRDKGLLAQLREIYPGVFSNMTIKEVENKTGKSVQELIKVRSSGLRPRRSISDRD